MKNLLFLILTIFTVSFSYAQDETTSPSDSQPKYTIKTSPFSNFWGNFKIAGDLAINERSTLETQIGLARYFSNRRVSGAHAQLRYKTDIIKDNKTLSGFYYAPGFEFGRWLQAGSKYDLYGSFLMDVGYQFNFNNINMEIFGGASIYATSGSYSEGEAGCVGCGTEVQANTIGIGALGFRLGSRIGIAW